MRDRCHAPPSNQDIDIVVVFFRDGFGIGPRAAAKLPRGGRFCRAVYAPLTIKGRSFGQPTFENPRCASQDRTAPRLGLPPALSGGALRAALRCRTRHRPPRPAPPPRP